ncbi:hypothetical protein MtrunA17_Chr7g0268811 [Medicago truncatula]|uniref:Uncharacterized protein n=1 Tax=Medicago truncatula TaxID=3880 RepID=A0A396H6N7_MEDTR|nr:hypothetical protein MtrunA17_Chr7g0268811 [Medicago truncatula]
MAYVCKQGSDFENVEDTKYTLSKFLVILVSHCTIYSKAICQVWFVRLARLYVSLVCAPVTARSWVVTNS